MHSIVALPTLKEQKPIGRPVYMGGLTKRENQHGGLGAIGI